MANLIDIASSALNTYRTALTITGENIANVNTDGYRRRDVITNAVQGGQTTPVTTNSGGQGVIVEDVRRAFDGFLAGRVYSTNSAVTAASTQVEAASAIEDVFLPGAGGVGGALDDFFASFGRLSSAPGDMSLRTVALESARGLTTAISDVAVGLSSLRSNILIQAEIVAEDANTSLANLGLVQSRMGATVNDRTGGTNPIMDQRDKLIGQISDQLGVNVQYDIRGRATIRLGDNVGGPALLSDSIPVKIDVTADPFMELSLTREGTVTKTTMLTGGALAGYARALSAVDDAMTQLDSLARRISGDINAVHAGGIDMNGNTGGPLFSLEGWSVKNAVTNQGSGYANISVIDAEAAAGLDNTVFTFDGTTSEWIASNASGDELARGGAVVSLNGMTVTMTGNPYNGDRITLNAVTGRAMDFKLDLTDPSQIAAAAASIVAPDPTNQGSAQLSMTRVPIVPPAIPLLSDMMPLGASGADATTFLQPGAVGYIPAGTTKVDLASLGRQSSAEFAMSDGQAASTTGLSITLGGASHSIAISGAASVAEVASFLNSDAAVTSNGETFADLGLFASGTDGALTIASGSGAVTSASLAGAGLTAATSPAEDAGATISLFTRNGVQISGPKLDEASAAQILTKANGFFDGARYVSDFVDVDGGTGYRGLESATAQSSGSHQVVAPLDEPSAWMTGSPAPTFPAHTLSFTEHTGRVTSVTLAQGASAAEAAELANAALDGVSVSASASAAMAVSADGDVSFRLESANLGAITINATVVNGRLDDIAAAINAETDATGVTASVSPDGSRLMFGNTDGETLKLTNFSHSAGGTAEVAAVDAQGVSLSGTVILSATQNAAAIRGTLSASSSGALALGVDGTIANSARNVFAGGLVGLKTLDAGSSQRMTFNFNQAFDAGSASADGLTAQSGSGLYEITALGRSFSFDAALGGAQGASDIAAGVAGALRERAPVPSMTGGVVPLPPDGTETQVLLQGDAYTLRMVNGGVEVTGPEEGRVTAAFDASGAITISATSGALDGSTFSAVSGTAGLSAFGLSAAQSPQSRLTGAPLDGAGLPATLTIEVDGTEYALGVSSAGATLPAGFPGTASVNADGGLELTLTGTPDVHVPEQASGEATGFSGLDARAHVSGDTVTLTSNTGQVIDLDLSVQALASERVSLSNLPAEDLIVVLGGTGTLRLAGSFVDGGPLTDQAGLRLEVTDAENGLVDLLDAQTGDLIARQALDANGSVRMNGVEITVKGDAATGDSFSMMPNTNGHTDGRSLDAIAALRNANPMEGRGGFAEILAALQAEKGAQVAAASSRLESAEAMQESANRIYTSKGAVNLDEEAARIVEQQQAYQASAQIMNVARQMFDVLINSL